MFGLGFGEILIILVLALLLLGPKKLPEAAKTIGKGLREFRKATDDLKGQIETEINLLDDDRPKPALVPSKPPMSMAAGAALAASVDNIPGLDAAIAEAPPAPTGSARSEPGAPGAATSAAPPAAAAPDLVKGA
jgi:sec-independent protein translocase protein TatB